MLHILLLYLCVCPHVLAAQTAVPALSAPEQQASVTTRPFAIEVSSMVRGRNKNWADVSITVSATEPSVGTVTITGHGPDGMVIQPAQKTLNLLRGKQGTMKFRVYKPKGNWADQQVLSFSASENAADGAYMATVTVDWPQGWDSGNIFHRPHWRWSLMVGTAVLVLLLSRRVRLSIRNRWENLADPRFLLDLFTLLVVEIFIFSKLNPEYLFTNTITTGGDTASHYYTLQYLRDVLLPAGQVSGWTPGNYAGFPILQFYFPLDFLFMTFLNGFMSLQVAFKLGSIAGTVLLPIAAYSMLRLMRCPFPGPGIAAALTLPFLFNSSHSMWGGNILSSFAGEFSYSLSMALSLILLGSLYRGARSHRRVVTNAILVFLVGFSHGYTLLFAEAMSLYLLITLRGFIARLFYLGKVYALAFCLLAFWLVPLLVFTKYTTSYDLVWTIHSIKEVFPPLLLPALLTGAVGSLGVLIWSIRDPEQIGREALPMLGYLWFGLAMCVVFFVAAPRLGVVDIRYVPYGHLIGSLLAALSLGWLGRFLRRWGIDWALLPAVLVAAVVWTGNQAGPVSDWAKWNYEGFEAKATWPVFEQINQILKGDFNEPRVVYEHSELHNSFGSSRAFESLPLFAGRATLEGLYMQASISAPFVFYIQSEVSQQKSVPFPQYSYSSLNYDRARPHLEMFNVRNLIIRSDHAKKAIRLAQGYVLTDTVGEYELWELTTNRNRYVELPDYEPVLFPTSSWKQDSHQWFGDESLLQIPLVFVEEEITDVLPPFKALARRLDELPRIPVESGNCTVEERIGNQEINIETDCIGKPLLVKMSYHPNWQVEGADRIYLTSPSFMLIYPEQRHVRLYYGSGPWNRIGQALTVTGLIILLINIPLGWRQGSTLWQLIAARIHVRPSLVPQIRFNPGIRNRSIMLIVSVVIAGAVIARTSYVVYHTNPNRIYNNAIFLKDEKRFDEAREGFRSAMQELGASDLAQNAAYYIGITYYLEKKDQEAIAAFEDLIRRYPRSNWIPEVEYHIGQCLYRSGQESQGNHRMQQLCKQYPGTRWAGFAGDRLREHKVQVAEQALLGDDNIDHYMGIAIDHFNHDRLEEAKALLQDISDRYPDYSGTPQALAALALVYYKQGNCGMTLVHYGELINRYPGDSLIPEAYYHLGLCNEKLGDLEKGQGYLSRAARDYPDTVYGRQALERLR